VQEKRAPDPFRPGTIPDGQAYEKAGRPATAVFVVGLVVIVALAFIVWAIVR
jgi:hypothetical protein